MKFFRKNKRVLAAFTLISIINQFVFPVVATANTLTGEQQTEHQPSGGGGDIVNPMNGSLQYSLPGITIPGPGLSYSVSFNYNSDDVKMGNEPSCIGVGWTMTTNSITRNLVDKPDDHSGKLDVANVGEHGYDFIQYRRHLKAYERKQFILGGLNSKEYGGLPFDPNFLEKKAAANANADAVSGGEDLKKESSTESSMTASIYYDNFNGVGFSTSVTTNFNETSTSTVGGESLSSEENKASGTLTFDSQAGFSTSVGFPLSFFNLNLTKSAMTGLTSLGASHQSGMSTSFMINSEVSSVDMAMETSSRQYPFQLGINLKIPGVGKTGEYDFTEMAFSNEGLLGSMQYKTTTSRLKSTDDIRESYGYYYRGYKPNSESAAGDYIQYSIPTGKNMPFTPYGKPGKDIFVQSSNGAGGAFELKCEEVEGFSPDLVVSDTRFRAVGGEFGLSRDSLAPTNVDFQLGIDITSGSGSSTTSGMTSDNLTGINGVSSDLNKTSFVKSSEVQISASANALQAWGGNDPVTFQTSKQGFSLSRNYKIKNDLRKNRQGGEQLNTVLNLDKNVKNNPVQVLNHIEAVKIGKSNKIGYLANIVNNAAVLDQRGNHFAEFTTTEQGGVEYTYGEPVYNFTQTSTTFAIDHPAGAYKSDQTIVTCPPKNWEEYSVDIEEEETENGIERVNETVVIGRFKAANSDVAGTGVSRNGVTKELLDEKTLSPFANHWLLSCITSRDYEDLNDDGFTADDQGSYVYFNYVTTHNERGGGFRYRFPYEGVSLQHNVLGEVSDDLAFVKTGLKEVKYVKEIHTKTHYAVFVYGDEVGNERLDGYPARGGKDGGIDNESENLKRLDHIKLYLKKSVGDDLLLESVYLNHDYSLMPFAPDNIENYNENTDVKKTGRLTLKEIYRTNFNSIKGEKYRYKFDYDEHDQASNPNYNAENVDAFGYFKRNKTETGESANGLYPYSFFPYVDENELYESDASIVSDVNNAPYCLKSILTPQGGKMEFDYEPRTYSYVNDKRATVMFDIVGLGDFENGADNRNISSISNYNEVNLFNENELVVKLDPDEFTPTSDPSTLSNYKDNFYNNYLKHVKDELYIKAYVYLNSSVNYALMSEAQRDRDFEFIELPAILDKTANDAYEVFFRNNKPYGKFKIKKVLPVGKSTSGSGGGWTQSIVEALTFNPIRVFGWEKIKSSRTDVLFGKPEKASIDLSKIITTLPTVLGPTKQFIAGNYASKIRLNGWSKVRLSHPTKSKKGSGFRVKSVKVYDNWLVNSADASALSQDRQLESYSYKQVYDYTTIEGGEEISSGVAVEPVNGREQSPNYKLYLYKVKNPLGEPSVKFFPGHPLDYLEGGGSLMYSKVKVSTDYSDEIERLNSLNGISLEESDIDLSKVGYSVYEYHTAKDYPNIKMHTDISLRNNPISISVGDPRVLMQHRMGSCVSQGYSYIKNGMQGTLKSIKQFNRNDKPISGQVYKYYTQKVQVKDYKYNASLTKMTPYFKMVEVPNNDLATINENGEVHRRTVGESSDIWVNSKKNTTSDNQITWMQLNLGFVKTFNFQNLMPLFGFPTTKTENVSKYFSVNKVINRLPVLQEVKTIKNQSEIVTQYLLYDDKTAAPVLTRVENEYPDLSTSAIKDDREKIYKLVRPAYWKYSGFNRASETLGFQVGNLSIAINSDSQNKQIWNLNFSSNTAAYNIAKNKFVKGDKLAMRFYDGRLRTAYLHDFEDATGLVKLYAKERENISGTINSLKVVKSGNNNALGATLGELVSKEVSLNGTGYNIDEVVFENKNPAGAVLKLTDVLNASAITYKGDWPARCCSGNFVLDNPYINGELNTWRPYKSYVYHEDRDHSNEYAHKTGVIINYKDFNWTTESLIPNQWVLTSQADEYNNHNSLIQSSNAIGLSSTSIYGYGDFLMIGQAGNSDSKETLIENFEQNEYVSCENSSTINLTKNVEVNSGNAIEVTDEDAHTGRFSLKISGGNKVEVKKYLMNCTNK